MRGSKHHLSTSSLAVSIPVSIHHQFYIAIVDR